MVIVLGIMIVIHEFGHFAAAKLFGVRVEVFSVGFGTRLLGFRRGDTDYRISALPFGGYVKMAGENPMEERTGDPGEFMSHPRWQRFIIAVAGPAMNILLAIGLLTGVYMVRYEHPIYIDQAAVIGTVEPDTPAAKAGLEPGDRIVRMGNQQNPIWEDVILKVAMSPNQPMEFAIQRGNQILTKTVVPEARGADHVGSVGWYPSAPLVVTALEPDMPAMKAGMQIGDEIVSVDGQRVRSTEELRDHLKSTKTTPVTITAMRQSKPLQFKITPFLDKERDDYRIGIASNPIHVDKLPFGKALSESLEQNKKNSLLILELLRKMTQHHELIKQMQGPIGIARVSGEAARQEGWTPILLLMSAISLNLGIFNLFPIPILDGGLILLLCIEGLMRRDISQPVKERIYQAAFICLILFAGMVIFNDVMKLLPGIARHF